MSAVSVTFRIVGKTPLLMHNGRLANPFDEFAIAIKKITSKRTKTEADQLDLFWLEWQGGMYFSGDLGPIIPAANLESCINDGARTLRRGQDTLRGVTVFEDAQLESVTGSNGSTKYQPVWTKKQMADLRGIYDTNVFQDVRGIVNPSTSGRSMRCRPIFKTWAAKFTAMFDPEILNRDDLIQFVTIAGNTRGICDGKPKYGRFSTQVEE